jgi:hypothetical protein
MPGGSRSSPSARSRVRSNSGRNWAGRSSRCSKAPGNRNWCQFTFFRPGVDLCSHRLLRDCGPIGRGRLAALEQDPSSTSNSAIHGSRRRHFSGARDVWKIIDCDHTICGLVEDCVGEPTHQSSPIVLVDNSVHFGIAEVALDAGIDSTQESSPKPTRRLSYQS